MRFRRLTLDELDALKNEFIQFLASNTITGEDWKKLKEEQLEIAEKLIDVFSDIVMEKSLSKVHFLEKREPNNVLLFYAKETEIDLIGISIDSPHHDLTNEKDLEQLMQNASGIETKMFKSSKPYIKNREDEVFEMLQSGCLITDSMLFTTLSKV